MSPIFVSGIGTDVGKTVISAILTEALGAHYWKPVQAGYEHGTDSEWVADRISGPRDRILPEAYKLEMPASPHIAARKEGITIDLDHIASEYHRIAKDISGPVIVEGAGGLMVPLNNHEFVIDLAKKLDAVLILVSRNYLGSINHSLLSAELCKSRGVPVAGWVFNDQYLHYEQEIAAWTGIPSIGGVPHNADTGTEFIQFQADSLRASLLRQLQPFGVSLDHL